MWDQRQWDAIALDLRSKFMQCLAAIIGSHSWIIDSPMCKILVFLIPAIIVNAQLVRQNKADKHIFAAVPIS